MSMVVAVGGKGGVGKTAIAALLADLLSAKGVVLAIDADPSENLGEALGIQVKQTIGQVREDLTNEIQEGKLAPGVAKQDILDLRIAEAMVESPRIDLLTMGRPEGQGCYCAANHMLRRAVDRLMHRYQYVVVDNEAGMEHISRRTTEDVDVLLLVSDPTMRGVSVARRMKELVSELKVRVKRVPLVINRVRNGLPPELRRVCDESGLEIIATIPEDLSLPAIEITGQPVTSLSDTSALKLAVRGIAAKLNM
ncbi:MAG: AAA family ATPase [Chloroflexota bacterium]